MGHPNLNANMGWVSAGADLEHVEHYGSLENIIDAFRRFVDKRLEAREIQL